MMSDKVLRATVAGPDGGLVVVGTDTDVGKTAFSLLVLHVAADAWDYWKPVETGPSDSAAVRRLAPVAVVHPPLAGFRRPVAPPLAARDEGRSVPAAEEIVAACPATPRRLLVETFGGPLSPLTETQLQIELIRAWNWPAVLVASSRLGAVSRTLSTLRALAGVTVAAVVLIGPPDAYAAVVIAQHSGLPVYSLNVPEGEWTPQALQAAARQQEEILRSVLDHVRQTRERQRQEWATLRERDRAAVWHPYSRLVEPLPPLPVVAAEREFLILADGRRVIDAISSWWTILHGHNHPPLVQALTEAAARLDHVIFAGATHPAAVQLAERLLATLPWPPGGRVFYSDNGSTAVEVALKIAYHYWCLRGQPQRQLFLSLRGGYHGDTFGAMAVGRDPTFFGMFEPFLFEIRQVDIGLDAIAAAFRENGPRLAAMIVEPLVLGAGGMRMYPPPLLQQMAELARSHDVILIVDEVMTGCRTGRRWAMEHAAIVPDIVCAAKTLTGGILPLAATLVSPRIVELFVGDRPQQVLFHGHSFTANPLACAVAAVHEQLLQQSDWRERSACIEQFWRERLLPLRTRRGVRDVRICGTIAAVELELAGGYLTAAAAELRRIALEQDVLLRPLGPVAYAMPPLGISRQSLERIAATFERLIDHVATV